MMPRLRWTAPLTWPAANSLSSRVSTKNGRLAASEHFFVAFYVGFFDIALCVVNQFQEAWTVCHCLFHPSDIGSDRGQFGFDVFVAAIDVINAIDHGFAFCDERREDERSAGAQVGGDHTRAGRDGCVPATIASRPSSRMFAPMRISSWACMKRFSKIVSLTMEMPLACVISAMYCA